MILGIESVKTAADVYSLAKGEILQGNGELTATPELVNNSPEADGWLVELKIDDESDLESLMDREAYENFIKDL